MTEYPRTPAIRFPSVGYCIYCGEEHYGPSRSRLGDEHIIPQGLGGNWVLPQASCAACEAQINRAEGFCQGSMLEAFRYKLGIKGKRRGTKRPNTINVEFWVGGRKEVRAVPLEHYPASLALPVLPPPSIIAAPPGPRSRVLAFRTITVEASAERETLLSRYHADGAQLVSGSVDVPRFARMLAKIGHAYATAKLGPGNFFPLLNQVILANGDVRADHLVGGGVPFSAVEGPQHRVGLLEAMTPNGVPVIICRIALFGSLDFPEYDVAVGLSAFSDAKKIDWPTGDDNLFRIYEEDVARGVNTHSIDLVVNTPGNSILYTSVVGDFPYVQGECIQTNRPG